MMATWSAEERRLAQKAVDFIECRTVHVEGEMAGQPFLLEQWQERIIRELFGRLRADGTRKYRTAYIEIPRKNGKSTLCAAIAILLLSEDNEPGAQVYSAAIDRTQAGLVFNAARSMVEQSPYLSGRILPFRGVMETAPGVTLGAPGRYKVLSADAAGKKNHGLNVSGAVIDEFHNQPKNSQVWKLIKTGTGSRRQPLIVLITTAGDDLDTPCGEMHAKARDILDGKLRDDSFFAVIFAADPQDDWREEETWRKANPNLGISISLEYLREQCEEAQRSPAYEVAFRQLHLNQWTNVSVRWMPMEMWDACGKDGIDANELRGQRVCSGLDLGSTRDLTAHVLVFPRPGDLYDVVCRFFMPAKRLKERMKTDRQPYDRWAREGWLTLTEGDVISYREIRESICDDREQFLLRDMAYDRALTNMLTQELELLVGAESRLHEDDQLKLWPFGQGFLSMSDPTKTLLDMVRGKKIRHGGNPILRWMMDCVTVATDPAGNVKPVKPDVLKGAKRIDGVVALIMGLARAMLYVASQVDGGRGQSVYEERGVVVL